jgi:hypothetical protein
MDHDDVETLAEHLASAVREIERLRAEADETRARLDSLQLDVVEVVEHVAGLGEKSKLTYVHADWQSWVTQWLGSRISRGQNYKWCHQFDEHPEVAERLEALWHAWEVTWPKPAARIDWLRDGLDHQLAVISAADGPLRLCSAHERQHCVPPPFGDLGDPSPMTVRVAP